MIPTPDRSVVEQLAALVPQLPSAQQQHLLDFALFLVDRYRVTEPVALPQLLPRPEQESVVGAIKRLSQSFSMVDRSKMLHESAALMSEHLLQGRPAAEVIDDLERLFRRHYQRQTGRELSE